MAESDLYPPIKTFLQNLGFAVKGEVNGCDLLGVRDGEPPILVVCELKLSFNLELVLQGVDRAAACDEVWLAARLSKSGKGREHDTRFRNLCRRLGFGLLGVTDHGAVEVMSLHSAPHLVEMPNVDLDCMTSTNDAWVILTKVEATVSRS